MKKYRNILIGAGSAILLMLLAFFYISNKDGESELTLIPYKSGGKWGYIDRTGKILINPQFNEANVFINGIALVKSNDNKYGYIEETGKYKINPLYKDATFFSEDLACVVVENGKPQFIDGEGNVKFTVSDGDECGLFRESLATIKVGNKWGYIDKSGEMKINPQFDYASPFANGLAVVGTINTETGVMSYGYINSKGDMAINYQFPGAWSFSNGLAVVFDGKKCGCIDETGKYIINPQFDQIGSFENGIAPIRDGDMYGYIDQSGKIVINPQFRQALNFGDEEQALVVSSDGKYGFIDKKGNYTINPQFEGASIFFEDIAFVRSADKWGIIDEDGKYLVNPQFDEILNGSLREYYYNESYQFKTIQTDYFDITTIIEAFLEGSNEKAFRNITTTTTFSDIEKAMGVDEPSLITFSNYATSNNIIPLGENAQISGIQYNFQENVLESRPVYRQVQRYDAWQGGYYTTDEFDHYDQVFNDSASISKIVYTILLIGKGAGHGKNTAEALRDEIVRKCAVQVPSAKSNPNSEGIFFVENKHMQITIKYSQNDRIEVNVAFVVAD